jgi:folylpolyglutamate synthase/dihydropteroate synthase
VLRQLSVFDGRFYFTRTESERSAPPEELAKEFLMLKPGAQVSVFENPEDAIKKASENGTVAVIGSFYLAGAVLRLIKTAENNHLMTEE